MKESAIAVSKLPRGPVRQSMTATMSPATTGGSAMPEFRKLRTSVRPGGGRNASSEAMPRPMMSAIPVAAPDTVRERRTISYTSPFPVKMSRNASRMPSQMRSMTHLLYGVEAGSGVKSPGMNSGSPGPPPPAPLPPEGQLAHGRAGPVAAADEPRPRLGDELERRRRGGRPAHARRVVPRSRQQEEVVHEGTPIDTVAAGDEPLLVGRRVGDNHVQFAAAGHLQQLGGAPRDRPDRPPSTV